MNHIAHFNPQLLPKLRSDPLLAAIDGMPCTLRIASFYPGLTCSERDTCVPCHIGALGKGMSTRVSDLNVASGCRTCHAITDGAMQKEREFLMDKYPAAVMHRIMHGVFETQALLLGMGIITVKGGRII